MFTDVRNAYRAKTPPVWSRVGPRLVPRYEYELTFPPVYPVFTL